VIEYFPIISFLVNDSSLVLVFLTQSLEVDQRALLGSKPALSALLKSLFFEQEKRESSNGQREYRKKLIDKIDKEEFLPSHRAFMHRCISDSHEA